VLNIITGYQKEAASVLAQPLFVGDVAGGYFIVKVSVPPAMSSAWVM
jgi:hypothetical protein